MLFFEKWLSNTQVEKLLLPPLPIPKQWLFERRRKRERVPMEPGKAISGDRGSLFISKLSLVRSAATDGGAPIRQTCYNFSYHVSADG